MKHVMVDLETMGMSSNSAIISIGAIFFDPNGDVLGEGFYQVVDLESSCKAGMVMDPSTVMWWLKQSPEARAQFEAGNSTISRALVDFSDWFQRNGGEYLWGNGASFDNVILSNAYRLCGLKQPWAYWNDRCYRTMKGLHKDVKMERVGTYHSAIDDAKSQAIHLQKIFASISK